MSHKLFLSCDILEPTGPSREEQGAACCQRESNKTSGIMTNREEKFDDFKEENRKRFHFQQRKVKIREMEEH